MAGPRITQNRILAVRPHLIHTDGNRHGRIACIMSHLFVVGQSVQLRNQNKSEEFQIKRIVDKWMYLGAKGKGINDRADLSGWKVTDGTTIEAQEQERPKTPIDQIDYFIYAEEPINAERSIMVDLHGQYVDPYRWESNQSPGGKSLRSQNAAPFAFQFIPWVIEKFIGNIQYNMVETLVEGDIEKIFFTQDSTIIKELHLRYKDSSWIIVDETNALHGQLHSEDGDAILDESGKPIDVLAGVDIYGE